MSTDKCVLKEIRGIVIVKYFSVFFKTRCDDRMSPSKSKKYV